MIRILLYIFILKSFVGLGQSRQISQFNLPELIDTSQFKYFEYIHGRCPCVTENMTNVDLHEIQYRDYRKAIKKADSLTQIDFPCYEYRAVFICAAAYSNQQQYNFNQRNAAELLILKKPLHRDSTICPAWQIAIEKHRSHDFMLQKNSGSIYCDDEFD